MRSGEIASRIRQDLAKRADSLGFFQKRFGSLSTVDSAQAGRFFFCKDEIPQRIHLIRETVPDFESNVLDQADQILTNQFSLLGYEPLDYGKDIDWQLDIVNGKRSPLKPWPKINYGRFDEVGDCKITWELSRHQFLVTLAKAWLLTGEERFVTKLICLYYDWHRKNPYPLGINWASSLEVAFRSLSWIWVKELLYGCDAAAQLCHDITRALAFNAWYIRRYLSTYFSPNTHLQGEAVALYFVGTLFPSLPHASEWRHTGWKILMEHARSKVLEDGAYFEQSTHYHVYALDFFLHARILAARNESPVPGSYDDILKRMLRHLSCLSQAGPPPRLGDDDGGRVFDGQRNRAEHLCDPLAVGTALYGLPILKQPGVKATEEMLWLLGEEGIRVFNRYPEWKNRSSACFPRTGLYLSHAGADSRSQVVLDVGPLGGGSGGHGHADALGLTLNLDGTPLLVDPGTCNYVGPGSDRETFRTTQAHNTVTVDGHSQAEPRTPFSWFRWPKVQIEAIAFTPEFDFIAASHDGYSRFESPVKHRRTLFGPRQGFWFVLDELISDGPHDYALNWHLAPNARVLEQARDKCIVEMEGSRLHVLTASHGWLCTVEPGWHSPAYGRKEAAPVVRFTRKSPGIETIATVFLPETLGDSSLSLSILSQSLGVSAYRLIVGTRRAIFMFGDGTSTLQFEEWKSNAKFLYGVSDADDRPLLAISVHGNLVHYDGKVLHESTETVAHTFWQRSQSMRPDE